RRPFGAVQLAAVLIRIRAFHTTGLHWLIEGPDEQSSPPRRCFFWVAGSIIDRMICIKKSWVFWGHQSSQQIYSIDYSTLLQGAPTIWPPTEGLRLVAPSRLSPGRHTRPDFEPKVQRFGEPTGTAIDGHERQWRGRCWS